MKHPTTTIHRSVSKPHSLLLAGLLLCVFSGCTSVRITPASVSAFPGRDAERADSLQRWRAAVYLCNAFLASPERKTLPAGRIELGDQGMVFITGDTRLPIHIRCTTWGDVLIPFKMIAQERSDGFVVGLVAPKQSRALDNSFFKYPNGKPASDVAIAELILHELTHSYYRLGTVSFARGFFYYAECVALLRYRNHSQERIPYQTNAEFETFIKQLMKTQQQP